MMSAAQWSTQAPKCDENDNLIRATKGQSDFTVKNEKNWIKQIGKQIIVTKKKSLIKTNKNKPLSWVINFKGSLFDVMNTKLSAYTA